MNQYETIRLDEVLDTPTGHDQMTRYLLRHMQDALRHIETDDKLNARSFLTQYAAHRIPSEAERTRYLRACKAFKLVIRVLNETRYQSIERRSESKLPFRRTATIDTGDYDE